LNICTNFKVSAGRSSRGYSIEISIQVLVAAAAFAAWQRLPLGGCDFIFQHFIRLSVSNFKDANAQ